MSAQSCTGNDNFRTEVELNTQTSPPSTQIPSKTQTEKITGMIDKLQLFRLHSAGTLYYGLRKEKLKKKKQSI
jgi:hypothetical protein